MPKLNYTQHILLATAAQRDSGSLYPLLESLTPAARVANAVAKLRSASLAEERETTDAAAAHRNDKDLRFGLFVTHAGLQAIGVEPPERQPSSDAQFPSLAPRAAAARETKVGQVLALLSRANGATLAELADATGWLPHTTRAALTGFRKKGHTVERGKRGGETCYFVRAASAA